MKKLLLVVITVLVLPAYIPTAFSALKSLPTMWTSEWKVGISASVNYDGTSVGNPAISGIACVSTDGRSFDVSYVHTPKPQLIFYACTETDSGWQTAVRLSLRSRAHEGGGSSTGGVGDE